MLFVNIFISKHAPKGARGRSARANGTRNAANINLLDQNCACRWALRTAAPSYGEIPMNKLVVLIYPDQSKIDEASGTLRRLHSERGAKLYASAVVAKNGDGKLSVRRSPTRATGGPRPLLCLVRSPDCSPAARRRQPSWLSAEPLSAMLPISAPMMTSTNLPTTLPTRSLQGVPRSSPTLATTASPLSKL